MRGRPILVYEAQVGGGNLGVTTRQRPATRGRGQTRPSRRAIPHPEAAGPEVVLGLVGALGTDLTRLTEILEDALKEYGYEPVIVQLSARLRDFPVWAALPERPYDDRIEHLQTAGNELRSKTGIPGAMATLGVGAIQENRTFRGYEAREPVPRTAYIMRSLKHPAEEELLRGIYGSAFLLMGAYAPIEDRRKTLAREIARSRHGMRMEDALARADQLILRDDHEHDRSHGQLVRDAFPRADVFVAVNQPDKAAEQIRRVLDLLFGHPFHTPTRDEFAMFQARAAALRSADLGRQVGAVVTTSTGDIVAVGTNEVPKAGGGQYWEGDAPDRRDFQLGHSESLRIRRGMLAEILQQMSRAGWLDAGFAQRVGDDVDAEVSGLLPQLKDTTMMSVGEFGRTVHAEMAALLDAARRGVSVEKGTLFSTTFPCHNCTKHIAAAGLSRVVYIEPFPKSRAADLHDDAIVVDASGKVDGKVNFEPFVGVAPRRYMELFSMPTRETVDGSVVRFARTTATPRVVPPSGYVEAEEVVVLELSKRLGSVGSTATPTADVKSQPRRR